ncbi:LysR substrate-binding domain-containing protein [Streptosporangium sp. CA-135522]|uniref:LysR substrate-binding domain-containing protein n=1 Tax=Streptosporangium sp. CA-135522 TaxID=3240072 RepID=UPI003D90E590
MLVVRADHRLAGRGSVPLADLADEQFIDFPVGYGNRGVVDQAFAAAGLERQVALEVVDIGVGAQFVRHGSGVAFLPEFAAPKGPDLRVLHVSDHVLRWTLAVATSSTRRPSAAVRALLALVEEHLRLPTTR